VASCVASQGARPRRTAIATVSNSVEQCKIATVNKGFFLHAPGEGPCCLGPGYATVCGCACLMCRVCVILSQWGCCEFG
jgi:hypothetical protein